MALYEYQCQQCGVRSEVLQKMADAPLTTCTACGGPLKKLASSPSVQFKGSGWYVTDYGRNKTGGDSGKSEKGEKAEKTEKSEKAEKSEKSDSKSASPAKDQKKTGSTAKEK